MKDDAGFKSCQGLLRCRTAFAILHHHRDIDYDDWRIDMGTRDMINNGINAEDKSRMIQEYVPGKQITLAHMVTRPKASVYKKLGLPDDYHDAIGIMTITPSEATIIAADICTKAASIKLGFVDRFSGSVIIVGSTANVESALNSVITTFYNKLGFDATTITKT